MNDQFYSEKEWGDILFQKEMDIRKENDKNILKEFENELLKYESNEIEFIELILSNSQEIDSYNINFKSEDNNKIEIENILNKIIESEWGKSFLPKNINNLKINEKFEMFKNFINNLKND